MTCLSQILYQLGGGCATKPIPKDGGAEEFREDETQQSGHAQRFGPLIKNGRAPKIASAPERLSHVYANFAFSKGTFKIYDGFLSNLRPLPPT